MWPRETKVQNSFLKKVTKLLMVGKTISFLETEYFKKEKQSQANIFLLDYVIEH